MADSDPSETIRQAAADSVRQGDDIRRRMHDVMLEALKSRRFDREGVRAVVRAASEGLLLGAEGSRVGVRQALAEGLRGMDEALTRSMEAGGAALRQLAATGRGFSEHELKQSVAGLKRMQEDFVDTVSEVASSANERLRPQLAAAIRETLHAGGEAGRQAARLMAEFAIGGIELAGEFSARFAQLASGALSGMADALRKDDDRDPRG